MTRASSDGWVSAKLEDGVTVHVRAGRGRRGEVIARSVLIEADEVTTDTLRRVQPARILAALDDRDLRLISFAPAPDDATTLAELRGRARRTSPRRRNPVGRPDGTDDFYKRLADAYRSAAAESMRPAVVLADENEAPVNSVRRWIQEARRRGFLPPATRGRAG